MSTYVLELSCILLSVDYTDSQLYLDIIRHYIIYIQITECM